MAYALSPDMCFGKHKLAEDCRVPVEGEKLDTSWLMGERREVLVPRGTIVSIQGGSQGFMQLLLGETGYMVPRAEIGNLVVESA